MAPWECPIEAYAQQLIDQAPLPTPEQVARLRVILWGVFACPETRNETLVRTAA